MSMSIDPTGGPNDPRLSPEKAPSDGTRRAAQRPASDRGTDAARVTISASASSESWAATQSENVAAAGGHVADIDHANELVKQLSTQITAAPAAAAAAQANVSPRAALNLLG